ncbi:MAG: NADH-quinone oxidoreductase subunit C [Gammaproteobacteria bacterium]
MTDLTTLAEQLQTRFAGIVQSCQVAYGQITLEIPREQIHEVCKALRDEPAFAFEELMDVCGVDYLTYGFTQWQTEATTLTGFSRGVEPMGSDRVVPWNKPRFAAVYQLLSLQHNHRVRLRTFVPEESPIVDSVVDIWASANWFEREAFDLFGILFKGHPDLRRILTDYGFIGHPFRKDFPLIGNVEIRYDATLQRCVYEPVSIQPRTLVPKVIRQDHRYLNPEEQNNA